MGLFDFFRTSTRQQQHEPDLYAEVRALRTDIRGLETEWEATLEKVNKSLRKLAKRAEREGCEGCEDKANGAGPVGAPAGRISLIEARRRYPTPGAL